jgi:hypothetical protein
LSQYNDQQGGEMRADTYLYFVRVCKMAIIIVIIIIIIIMVVIIVLIMIMITVITIIIMKMIITVWWGLFIVTGVISCYLLSRDECKIVRKKEDE